MRILGKALLAAVVLSGGLLTTAPARAQALPNQVLALYPQNAGEVAYMNVRELRNSPHYARLKEQVLPPRFRELADWTRHLGIDFDSEIYQMSWAFLPADASGDTALVGTAEGNFPPDEIERNLKQKKLVYSREAGHIIVPLGKNEKGDEFIFAFLDRSTAIFGFREPALAMLARRTEGGASLLNNRAMLQRIEPVNGRSPVWLALDTPFTLLAVKQLLPGAETLPGYETLTSKLESATLRFDLGSGLRSLVNVRCKDSSDAVLVSTVLQAALTYQAWRINDTQPDLAKLLGEVKFSRSGERVDMALDVAEAQFLALLDKNSFALKF